MAVNIKLGNTVFTKERKIAELEEKVKILEKKVKEYESVNYDFQIRHKENEKMLFEMRNINEIKEIENKQLQSQIQKITSEKEQQDQQLQQLSMNYENLKKKQKDIMDQTRIQSEQLMEKSALVERLSGDLQKSENQQIKLEKEIHELCLQREATLADIRTLQKNIQQKDKFIAILNKEKSTPINKENKSKTKNQFQSEYAIDALQEISQVKIVDRLKNK